MWPVQLTINNHYIIIIIMAAIKLMALINLVKYLHSKEQKRNEYELPHECWNGARPFIIIVTSIYIYIYPYVRTIYCPVACIASHEKPAHSLHIQYRPPHSIRLASDFPGPAFLPFFYSPQLPHRSLAFLQPNWLICLRSHWVATC